MSTVKDSDYTVAQKILGAFARYGAQKTGMEDIAKAVGVSRQSIYKRFGSKKQCYSWAIHAYLTHMYSSIFSVLDNDKALPVPTLISAFDAFLGDAIEIVRNTHGTKVFDDALVATHASPEDWPLRFRARLGDYLLRHQLAAEGQANGMAFALISAAKGLLLEEPSREQFLQDMTIIIESVINQEI